MCPSMQVNRYRGSWGSDDLNHPSKLYCNTRLQLGLGQLGLRPRAAQGEEDLAPAGLVGGQTYIFTELGSSLWHDSMRSVFADLESARSVPMYWSAEGPRGDGQAHWLQSPICGVPAGQIA